MPTRILFLAANPRDTSQLRLGEEAREVAASLRRATTRNMFSVDQQWAVRHEDLRRAMLDLEPHIVHFSGHGAGEDGVVLEDGQGMSRPVTAEALSALFGLFPSVQCVVLNACYSNVQAGAISSEVKYVIGMSKAIGDAAAISFASGFYDALAANRPIPFAYEFGRTAALLAGLSADISPVTSVDTQIRQLIDTAKPAIN